MKNVAIEVVLKSGYVFYAYINQHGIWWSDTGYAVDFDSLDYIREVQ